MALSIFSPSVSGMQAQSHALGEISTNVANMNTVGYRYIDTTFKTLLSTSMYSSAVGGVEASDRQIVSKGGSMITTDNPYDLAINGGDNLFIVNDQLDGKGNTYYTRAGEFSVLNVDNSDGTSDNYLATTSGYYVMGWQADANGELTTNLGPLLLSVPGSVEGNATTSMQIVANLPVSDEVGSSETFGLPVFNAAGESHNLGLTYTRGELANNWTLSYEIEGGTVTSPLDGDVTAVFNTDGTLSTPTTMDISIDWDDGTSSTFTIDASSMTQYDGSKEIYVTQDGNSYGNLSYKGFNTDGEFTATYSNGVQVLVGKVAQAYFTAPQQLEALSGNIYQETALSGEAMLVGNGENDLQESTFMVQTIEGSNVDIADQFTKMITTQKAYSSAATTFKTADEMMQEAIKLKS